MNGDGGENVGDENNTQWKCCNSITFFTTLVCNNLCPDSKQRIKPKFLAKNPSKVSQAFVVPGVTHNLNQAPLHYKSLNVHR